MNEHIRIESNEIDCEVSVYDGSWATCDMVGKGEEEKTVKEGEDGD